MDVIGKKLHKHLQKNQRIYMLIPSVVLTISTVNYFFWQPFFPWNRTSIYLLQWSHIISLFFISYLLLQNLDESKKRSDGLYKIHELNNASIYQIIFFSVIYYIFPLLLKSFASSKSFWEVFYNSPTTTGTLQTFASMCLYISVFGWISLNKNKKNESFNNKVKEVIKSLQSKSIYTSFISIFFISIDEIYYKGQNNFLWVFQFWVLFYSMNILLKSNILDKNSEGQYASTEEQQRMEKKPQLALTANVEQSVMHASKQSEKQTDHV